METLWRSQWMSVLSDPPADEFFAAQDEVLVVATDDDGRLLLVEEPSPAFGGTHLFLPGGAIEADEDVGSAAQRELREETGFKAGVLVHVAKLRPWSKYLRVTSHITRGSDLSVAPLVPDELHQIVLHRKTGDQVRELVGDGQICDARTIAALALCRWFP